MVVIAKIIGEAAIRLRAESKTLGPEIRRLVTTAIKQAAAGIKQDTQTDTNGITDGIRRDAEKTSATVKSILGNVGSSLSSVNKAFLQTTLKAVTMSAVIGSLASSLSGTAALVGGLGEAISGMGAAAAGVGVAGLTALLALSTTLKIATSGMGDAFKAVAEGDAKALQEALKGMAPAARSFVTETAKLKPIFDDIKLSTQAALFKDLGTEVLATGKALGSTFKGLFVGIATQVNEAGKQVLKFLREARTVDDLGKISENVTGGFREMSQAGRSIVQVIVDIVKSSSELLPGLGRSIEELTKKFAAFIRLKSDSGELTEFFQGGIDTVKQFGRIIRDLGVGISNVFQIGSDSGGGFLNILERAATGFRDFTESIGGQAILTTVFRAINNVADAFGRFLTALKPVLGPLGQFLELLSEGIAQILDEIGPQLSDTLVALFEEMGKALPVLIPAIIKLANAALKLVEDLSPLIVVLAKVASALIDVVGPTNLAAAALVLLGGKIGLVVGAGVLLGVTVASLIKGFQALGRIGVPKVIDGILEQILHLPPGAADGVNRLIDNLVNVASGRGLDLKKTGRSLFDFLADGFQEGSSALANAMQRALHDALLIMTGQKPSYEQGGLTLMQAINEGFQSQEALLNMTAERAVRSVLELFGGKTNDFDVKGRQMGAAFTSGMTAEQAAAVQAARRGIQAILDALSGRKSEFDQQGRDISARLGRGIAENESAAVSAARNATFAIAGAFGGVSLFGEGAAIMSSLRSGLVSGIQAVRNVLTSMTSLIPTWKGPETLDRKLLTPAGKAIMDGLVRGIESEIPTLRSTLAAVTQEIATGLNPASGMSLNFTTGTASPTGSGITAGGGTVVLQQTNNMLPGADVNQFAAEVWRRGAQDLTSGNSTLGVSQKPIQAGLAAPGSFVTVGA